MLYIYVFGGKYRGGRGGGKVRKRERKKKIKRR